MLEDKNMLNFYSSAREFIEDFKKDICINSALKENVPIVARALEEVVTPLRQDLLNFRY